MKNNILHKLFQRIFTICAMLAWSFAFAVIEKTPMCMFKATTQNPFINNSTTVEAEDDKFTYMSTHAAVSGTRTFPVFYNKKITNRIMLVVEPDQLKGVVTQGPIVSPVAYNLSVVVRIKVWKYNAGTSSMDPTTLPDKTLTVSYDPAKRYPAQAVVELVDDGVTTDAGNRIEVKVISHTLSVANTLPYRISLGAQVEVERYYSYEGSNYGISINKTYDGGTGLLKVDWATSSLIHYASTDPANLPEEYELEWIYVDNYKPTPVDPTAELSASELLFNNYAFEKNSTRITTKNNNYFIPVIYPKGFIVYRVRPLWRTGYDGYSSLAPGIWSSENTNFLNTPPFSSCAEACATVGGLGGTTPEQAEACIKTCVLSSFPDGMYYKVDDGHETFLNWQYSLSFAEEGKSVASVNYFDGSYKSRQTVIKSIKDNCMIDSRFEQSTVASDIVYDYNGRAAVTTMPVPTDQQKIQYNRNFNRSASGKAYAAENFDLNEESGCNTIPDAMSDASGSSRYYSPNHEFPSGSGGVPRSEEKFIPDAKGYPFMQTIFAPDNIGRPIKKSGAGADHAIGSGRETKYFYGKPFQEELDRWFGTEVGDASHYKKDMVIDANGQISISYLNPAGKVIATNLGGVKPMSMVSFDVEPIVAPLTVDILHKSSFTAKEPGTENRVQPNRMRKIVYRELLVDRKQQYYFGYEVKPERLSMECPGADSVCYDCVLDLNISLTDECGNEYLAGVGPGDHPNKVTVGQEILDQLNGPDAFPDLDCDAEHPAFNKNINSHGNGLAGTTWSTNQGGENVQLEVGNYSLKKVLTVNREALDHYTENYMKKECLKDIDYFRDIEELRISKTGCEITCVECKAEIGAFELYDCDNPAHNSVYPCLSKAEYDRLIEECDEYCDYSVKCKAEFQTMLTDMSPQGQYGQISKPIELFNGSISTDGVSDDVKPYLFNLSVFNEGNFLPIKTDHLLKGLKPNWRYPYVPYQTEAGAEDFVTVTKDAAGIFFPQVKDASKAVLNPDGTYRIKPQYLSNVSDFLNYWKPSWSRSLIYYHPEYVNYELCTKQSASHDFDEKWLSMATYNEALTYYGNDGPNNPYFLFIYNAFEKQDPYFATSNPFYDLDDVTQMANATTLFLQTSGSYMSMFELAFRMTACPNFGTTCSIDCTSGGDLSTLSTDKKNEFWNNFKMLYYSLKQRMYDKKMTRLSIEKGGYNGCIGTTNFDAFKHNFALTQFVLPAWIAVAPWNFITWWSQYYNFEQPCNIARYAYYKDKVARFQDAEKAIKLDGFNLNLCYNQDGEKFHVVDCSAKAQKMVDEAKNLTELAVFKQCGQCPVAFDLQNLMNEMLTGVGPALYASSASVKCTNKSLTERLLTALGGNMYADLTWSASSPAMDEERDSRYFEGSFSTNYPCSLRLQFPDGTGTDYNFSDILQFYTLKYDPFSNLGTQTNGSFTVIAVVKEPGYDAITARHLTKELVMKGSFPCMDFANCSFKPICKASKDAVDLQNLFNNLLADKHPRGPSPVSGTSAFLSSSAIDLQSPFLLTAPEFRTKFISIMSIDGTVPPSFTWRATSYTNPSGPSTSGTLNGVINGCAVQLTFPVTSPLFEFGDIVSFSNIMPDPEGSTPSSFLITALVNDGSAIQYVQLKGSAYCLNMGSCSTELPYPYQMGKPEKEDLEYTLSSRLVTYLMNAVTLNEKINLISDNGKFNATTETNRCSVEFALPTIPGFTFSMVKKIVDVRPDKTSTGVDRFIAYALLEDGRIVPLIGSTRSECYGTVSACRFYEEVKNGTFASDELRDCDIHDFGEEDVCETNGMDIINGDYTVACEFIRDIQGHTANTDEEQFLLINTDPDGLKRKAWSQDIPNLQVGREYVFKMYYMSANENPIAEGEEDYLWVEFLNGMNLAPSSGTILKEKVIYDPVSGWKEYTFIWKANASSVTINIYAEGHGHNFIAIDDISFGRSCPCIPTELLGNGYIDYSTSQPLISQFTVQSSTTLADNHYAITASASTPSAVIDRTRPGQGKFMFFKISPETTLTAYENTVYIEPGKEYVFNAWYFVPDGGFYATNPDKLKITLKVNGQVVHQLLNATSRNIWNSIEGRWFSGGNTSAKVEVVLTNLYTIWESPLVVALDDITLMRMCQPQFCQPLRELELPPIDPNPCLTHMNKIIELNAKVKYAEYLVDVKKQFQDAYIAKCLQSYETFLMKYDDGSNHITLYYYDQAGNLVRTIPPEGVRALSDTKIAEVETDRINGTRNVFTDHTYATTYRYNSLNQLVSQSVPDNVDLNIWEHSAANSGINSGYSLKGMSFVSKYGLTAGVQSSAGKMYKTSNSGESWTAIAPELKLDNIIDLHMIDASNGVALASNGRYLVTNDGALTWEIRALPTTNDMVKMRIVGTSVSACTTYVYDKSGAVWRSINLGAFSPVSVTTPLPSGAVIRVMNFYGSGLNNGVAITTDNKIYYTTNGGVVWTSSAIISTDAALTELQQVNGYVYVATGKNGTLLRSSDKGISWTQVNTKLAADMKEAHFSTVNDGCMLDMNGNLYTTKDGGNSWDLIDLVKNKLNDDGPYTDLAFYNKNEGYAVNSAGQLLYTNNGGKGWANRNNASALTDISALQVINANELFFMGTEGKIYYSLNSGNTIAVLTPSSTPYTLSIVPAMKELHLSLNPSNLHYTGICYDASGIVYDLDVNLVSGTAVYNHFGGASTPTGGGKNMYFITAKEGYMLFNTYAWKTTDACSTWTGGITLPSGNQTNAIVMGSGGSVSEGVIVGEAGIIYKTIDDGITWTSQSTKITPMTMNMVKGASATDWVIVGDKGNYLHTTNSCSTWVIRSNPETADFRDVSINGSADVMAAGTGGTIKSTIDNGITWVAYHPGIDPGHDIQGLKVDYSVTPYRGTATTTNGKIYNLHNTYYPTPFPSYAYDWDLIENAGSSSTLPLISYYGNTWLTAGLGGKLYKTANIATVTPVWASAAVIKLPELYDVKLVDENTAYAVGRSGTILRTGNFKDAASHWELHVSNTTQHLYGIDFFSQKGVAVGAAGTIVTTGNGGSSWTASTLGSADLNDVSIYSSDFGYIVGNSKTVYKNTTNVIDDPWTAGSAASVPSVNLHGVHLVNKKYGVIVGESGTVCKVDNSNGANSGWAWAPITNFTPSASSVHFKDVYFRDYKTGYVVGTGGKLYKTADGSLFNSESTGTVNNLEAIAYADHKNIFIGGANGEVRKISDEKNLSSSIFYYDKLGRLVVSQNAKQREKTGGPYIYSYTVYDAKGRIVEVGEKKSTTAIETTYENETGRMSDALYATWLSNGDPDTKTEVTRTYYDEELISSLPLTQTFLRNRVATVTHEAENDDDDEIYDAGTHYSYDIHGNVKSLVQEFQSLPLADKFKRTDYEYDLVSGKVNKLVYQQGEPDQFMHKYDYDEENKLTHVYTSNNGAVWEQDARYLYYRHGPLARTELGDDKVQGLDYAYTIQGWLKGVNSNTVTTPSRDMGRDGVMAETNNPNRYFAQDEIGYSLGYYKDENKEDYTAISTPLTQDHFLAATPASSSLYTQTETKQLFNGNISSMVTGIRKFMQGSAGPQAMIYSYDQLNRIRATNMTNAIDMTNNQWLTGTSTAYNETFHYDGNGNITSLTRKNELGQLMDDLQYKYLDKTALYDKNTNKLGAVKDNVGGGTTDIKSGQTFDDNTDGNNIHTLAQDNYEYDNIGNLVKDKSEEIAKIEWTVSGKIKSITRTAYSAKPDLEFIYDAAGNRIAKIVKPAGNNSDANWRYTIYVRDAQGNVLSTYERKTDKIIDYAALNYDYVNAIIGNVAGTGAFASFISQMHYGNTGMLNGIETYLSGNTVLSQDILLNDRSPITVMQNYPKLGHTLFMNADQELILQNIHASEPGTAVESIVSLCYCNQTGVAPKYTVVDHLLTDDYSRKHFLWGGVSQYMHGGCWGDQYYNIANYLGFAWFDPYDYLMINSWMDNFINATGSKSDRITDLHGAYTNYACMSGNEYDCNALRDVLHMMQTTMTDEPQPALYKVAAKLPAVKMQVSTMAMMKEYYENGNSMLNWMSTPGTNVAYLVKGLYMYDFALASTVMNSILGVMPVDENDAVTKILISTPPALTVANAIRYVGGIDDMSLQFLHVLQGIYSAYPTQFEYMFSSFPNRALTLNNPDLIEEGANAVNNFGLCTYYDQMSYQILARLPGSNADLWAALMDFDHTTNPSYKYDADVYNKAWYINEYRMNAASQFLSSFAIRKRSWISGYQTSNNLYGGANGGMNNYFTQIRNYFGPDIYERFEQEIKNNSTRYADVLTLEDWNIYGSSRVGSHHVNKTLYTQDFTGTVVASKLVKSAEATAVVTAAYNGQDITMRGDKRFELSNHLGNVLTVVSDRISTQQANYSAFANYASSPGGYVSIPRAAAAPLVLTTVATIAGQTYKLDVKCNANTTGQFTIVVNDYPSGRIISQQVFTAGSTTATEYSLLYRGASTACQILLTSTAATSWHLYNFKAQQVYTNPAAVAPVMPEQDYSSGTGTWYVWSANLTPSNDFAKKRLKIQSTATPSGIEGAASGTFTTVPGRQYRVRAYIDPVGITTNTFIFGHQDNGFTGFNSQVYVNTAGWYEINFTARTTSTSIITGNYQLTPFSYYIDDFSVREISTDQYRRVADVLQATDYYAFGSPMPGRTFDAAKLAVKKPLFNNAFETPGNREGWSELNANANVAQNTLRLRVQYTAHWGSAVKTMQVIPGRKYILRFTVDMGAATALYVPIYNNALTIWDPNLLIVKASGSYEYQFTGNADGIIKILFEYPSTGNPTSATCFFDNISLEEDKLADGSYVYGFNGKENDNENGTQDYGMRIYNPNLGKFLSVDPISKEYPNLSTYQFASNTPLQATDLDGLEAFYIHGTWSSPRTYPLITKLTVNRIFNNTEGKKEFDWSGYNSDAARQQAACELVHHVLMNRDPRQQLTLIGHSHGGNVAILAINILKTEHNLNVDNLLTINTPVREYQLNKGILTKHYNVYHEGDPIQGNAGNDYLIPDRLMPVISSPGAIGFIPIYAGGLTKPSGETGVLKKRTFDNAFNIKVEGFQNYNPLNFHDSHQRVELWGATLDRKVKMDKLDFKLDVGKYLQKIKQDNTKIGN